LHIPCVKILQTILSESIERYFVAKNWKKNFRFKVSLPFRPYLYILIKPETLQETMAFLGKKYNGPLCSMEVVKKEDLVRPYLQRLMPFSSKGMAVINQYVSC
jgi:hypothetical protein